jgi:hypothetical protein
MKNFKENKPLPWWWEDDWCEGDDVKTQSLLREEEIKSWNEEYDRRLNQRNILIRLFIIMFSDGNKMLKDLNTNKK